jgi:hypothetical protein
LLLFVLDLEEKVTKEMMNCMVAIRKGLDLEDVDLGRIFSFVSDFILVENEH